MRYTYFPGCSLESTAREYNLATMSVMAALGAEMEEVEDWNCCGASAAETESWLLSLVLPARNLALAERANDGRQLVASCSACFVNLRKVGERIKKDPQTLKRINQALSVDNLTYAGSVEVRHLLDVLANDFGPELVSSKVTRPLTGLRVAPYYGCQTIRPFSPFDAPFYPDSMEAILIALGAEIYPNAMQATCCGGTLLTTKREVGLKLVSDLSRAVAGADCVVTVCPLCQMNLDSYQGLVSKKLGHQVHMPILYLTQLMGLAFGLQEEQLGFRHHIVSPESLTSKLTEGVYA